MSGAPDLSPIADADWPEAVADLLPGFAGQLNVYRTMAHDPELLRAWAPLRQHVVKDTALGPARSEVVILRTGHALGSPYEWAHHVVRARACGLSDRRIASLRGPVEAMEPEDALIAGAVDELFGRKALSQDMQARLTALVGVQGMLDLIATVGFYSVLGYLLNSAGTPIDAGITAALERDPLEG